MKWTLTLGHGKDADRPVYIPYGHGHIEEVLGAMDARAVLALEVGVTYTDSNGDTWKRIK